MISFNCPFCAKQFNVQDSLAGRSMKCPQCGADVAVPNIATPAPMAGYSAPAGSPNAALDSANRNSWFSVVTGVLSLLCCLSGLPAMLFGVVAMSKSGGDPALFKPAKTRGLIGLVLGLVFSIVNFAAFMMFAQKAKEEQDKEIAAADKAYDEKKWDEAKPLYEKHRNAANDGVKAKCRARLGHIAFVKGNLDLARKEFGDAFDAKNDFVFESPDKDAVEFWRKAVNTRKRANGLLTFEKTVQGPKANDVEVSAWRIKGKKIYFDLKYKTEPKKLDLRLSLLDRDEKVIHGYFWETDDLDKTRKSISHYTPDFEGDWDDIWKVVLIVDAK